MEGQSEARGSSKKLAQVVYPLHVGSAYGFPDEITGKPEWFLIVWADDESVTFPDFFDGYKVRRRGIPRAY